MGINFVLSTVTNDSVKAKTIECIEAARWTLAPEGVVWAWNVQGGDGKARARNVVASQFLETCKDVPALVFIDHDILFSPQNLKRLNDDLEAGYDLIGGLYPVRGGTQCSSFALDYKLEMDGKIHEFEYVSTGFMGISRKLLQKMVDEIPLPLLHPLDLKFYPFFEERSFPDREFEPIFLSEDWDFCEKARKVGIKPYIDTSIQLGHLGERVYTMGDVIEHQTVKGEEGESEAGKLRREHLEEKKEVALAR